VTWNDEYDRRNGNGAHAPPKITIDAAHQTFRRWLGDNYDIDALNATLATAAAQQLGGDPLWLLILSGSGNAKTETVQALAGTGAEVVSTISSDGALLSGTPKKQQTKDATGGLLRQIGDQGLLVIKDVTSILSMNRDTRATLLAAFRELHDGHWIRYLGTDGGRTLEWTGRLIVIGAVTTAWDRAHDVIASMGDRFIILRMDSTEGRLAAGRQSRRNVGHETQMRNELSQAAAGVLAAANPIGIDITDNEAERLLAAADLVTRARTGVDYDYQGKVIDSHAPEMPTRFMKQLVQVMRGAVAVGLPRIQAFNLAIRCARDSMPPLRLAILDDIASHPDSRTGEVRRRLEKPWSTIDRQLQSLYMLDVLECDEEETTYGKTLWRYRLAEGIDPSSLKPSPDLSVHTHKASEERDQDDDLLRSTTDKSGEETRTTHTTHTCHCGAPATDISGLCPGCLTNPGTHPPLNPQELF
jgi:hypothetical protein